MPALVNLGARKCETKSFDSRGADVVTISFAFTPPWFTCPVLPPCILSSASEPTNAPAFARNSILLPVAGGLLEPSVGHPAAGMMP
jgi:hypothetical protein